MLVGINLLREGLDLPEVAFIGILDADKEGYLRAYRSFIQIIGRAARNVDGHVVMYADKITDSMRQAIDETERRRAIADRLQRRARHHAGDASRRRSTTCEIKRRPRSQADAVELMAGAGLPREDLLAIVRDLEKEMKRLSKELQPSRTRREVRDRIIALRKRIAGEDIGEDDDATSRWPSPRRPKREARPARPDYRGRTRRGP